MKIVPAAEEAVMIYTEQESSPELLDYIQLLAHTIKRELGKVLTDLVPSFNSLMVCYDITSVDYATLESQLWNIIDNTSGTTAVGQQSRQVDIPVYYGLDVALDIDRVSQYSSLDCEQIIKIHTQQIFRVYALGFRPGFAFMGMLPDELHIPRLDNPRKAVPQGSVAIAEGQTSVYPDTSPGGWNIIGRCPLAMFNRGNNQLEPLLQVGDQVNFKLIDRDEFLALGGRL